ncbi:MAG: helix-turn-helix domain-containing protein [Salinivirgaceae bacterium]|jgi:HTH-type transcriptional regulator/antitoxin HigA
MTPITEKQYQEAEAKIEELLPLVNEDTPINDPNYVELKRVSDIVETYELKYYPIGAPTLREVIELRMFEMKLKQKDLAELLETSTSRISEYLNGKRDITLGIARKLNKKLNIDSDIILQE